jgi:hypothetical protein
MIVKPQAPSDHNNSSRWLWLVQPLLDGHDLGHFALAAARFIPAAWCQQRMPDRRRTAE